MDRSVTADILWIAFALGLVVLNGFFVAAEFALVKVRPSRLAHLAKQNRPMAHTAQWLSRRLDRSLSACQLGITVASLGLGWIGEPAVARLITPLMVSIGISHSAAIHTIAFAVSFTIITAAHLVLGEQAPKIFAIRRPEQLALWCAAPLRLFYMMSFPVLRLLDMATTATLRLAGLRKGMEHETPHSQEELRDLVGLARAHGELSGWEHRLVEAAFQFDDMVCRQVMVPRSDIVFIDVEATIDKVMETVKSTKHTRYPVFSGSPEEIVGILHVKDLLGAGYQPAARIADLLRPPRYVPESMLISRLLGHFRVTRQHMAMVIDEFGTTVGMVTLENVLEQIVGPVRDEFDVETPLIVPEGEDSYLVNGRAPIGELEKLLEVRFEVEDAETVAGLIAEELGRVPETGDHVSLDDLNLEVRDVKRNCATLVRIRRSR